MNQRIDLKEKNKSNLLYVSKTTLEKNSDSFVTLLHAHSNLEILIPESGDIRIKDEEQVITVNKNSLIFINPGSLHLELSISGVSFYALGINNVFEFLDNKEKKIEIREIDEEDYSLLLGLIKMIYQEAKYHLDNNIIDELYISFINIIKRNARFSFKPNDNNYSPLVYQIKRYIDDNYYSNPSLKDISNSLKSSIPTISNYFKKEMGISIIDYKIKVQLKEAENLLRITSMSITDISFAVGFLSTAYFIKMFKKEYQLTPKKYREEHFKI